jgi:hypothetical protein
MGKRTTAKINAIMAAVKKKNAAADETVRLGTELEQAGKERDKAAKAYQKYYGEHYTSESGRGDREGDMESDNTLLMLDREFLDARNKVEKLAKEKTKANKDLADASTEVKDLVDDLEAFVNKKAKDRILPWQTSSMKKARTIIKLLRGG